MKNKNTYMILGGIVILGTIFYFYNKNKNKKTDASTDANSNNSDVKSNTPNNTTNVRPKDCPSKEELASSKYTKEGMDMLKAKGCL